MSVEIPVIHLLFGEMQSIFWLYQNARVVELVDARDLDNLSAQKETFDVELRKFGEPFKMGIPSQAYLFKLR